MQSTALVSVFTIWCKTQTVNLKRRVSSVSATTQSAGYYVLTFEKHMSSCEGRVREGFLEEVTSMMRPKESANPCRAWQGVGSECFKPKE